MVLVGLGHHPPVQGQESGLGPHGCLAGEAAVGKDPTAVRWPVGKTECLVLRLGPVALLVFIRLQDG